MKSILSFIVLSILTLSFKSWTVSSFSVSQATVPYLHVGSRVVVTHPTLKDFHRQFYYHPTNFFMSSTQESEDNDKKKPSLPFLLDPGTKGGALFLSLVLFIIPIIGYEFTIGLGIDGVEAGRWIGVGFTVITLILWAASYVFRVATKDMTYAKQLKDYENAVIAKRLQELDSDEVQALMEDIERDDF